MRRFIPLLLPVCLLVLATSAAAQGGGIDDFFRNFTDEWVRANPNQATAVRYFTGPEQDSLERQLTPLTREWLQRRGELARRGLAGLATFDRAALTDVQRVSAELMKWQLELLVEGDEYDDYLFPLEQFGGANIGLVNALTIQHPLVTEKDAVNYLARLGQVSARMGEATAKARRLAASNMIPPRFILQATVRQMQQFIDTPPGQNPFVNAFDERMKAASGIPDARREELRAAAETVTEREIYPAWREAIAVLEPLVPRATDDAGLSRLPGGAAAYAYALRRFTSIDLSADEIHQIGLGEVARIEAQMDSILRGMGRSQGTVAERVEQLKREGAYPLTDAGRAQIMADIDGMIRDSQARSAGLFSRVPRAAVIARPFPRFLEANAAASYNAPARDGSRPGTFQMPLRPSRMTKFGLRTLVNHETAPGHHFQIALQVENYAVPRFRQNATFGGISAFTEGWALYAEQLAAEQGWYEGDPVGRLGQLDASLFRARRLVVDTGLHTKGWTRQQAIDYGIEASEIERYVVNPGQATAYMLGLLKIVELREKARTALGSRFSLSAFHDAVLTTGTVPLPVLEQQVEAFIRSAAAPAR